MGSRNIQIEVRTKGKINLSVRQGSAVAREKAVVSVLEDAGEITIKKADGESNVIKLVHTADGALLDEEGNVLLPYPVQFEILGDSKI